MKTFEQEKLILPEADERRVRQIVSVNRSTDKEGQIVSGKLQHIDTWVPRKWDQTLDEWWAQVFQ